MGKNKIEIKAAEDGYVSKLDALLIAKACKLLGAGRDKKGDDIDFGAGCILKKKTGDTVKTGETLLTLYFNDIKDEKKEEAVQLAKCAFEYSKIKPEILSLICK